MVTFQPLDTVPGRVNVENDGDVPTSYGVEVAIGRSLPTGFQAETSRIFFSGVIQPGASRDVQVPQALPEGIAGGPKTVRVRLGTVDAQGTLQRIFSQEFFSTRLSVMLPEREMPLPGEGPALPPAPEGLAPANISVLQPSAQPSEVQRGQRVTLSVPVRVTAVPGLPGPSANIQVTITTDAGLVVAQLPAERFDLVPGQSNRLDIDWTVTPDAPAGSYGARVRLWDPATLSQVGDLSLRSFTGLFRVTVPALVPTPEVAAPAPIIPEAFMPELIPTPVAFGPATTLVTVSAPTLRPLSGGPGRLIEGLWRVRNDGRLPVEAFIRLSGLPPRTISGDTRTVEPGQTVTLQAPGEISATQPPGPITAVLALRDGFLTDSDTISTRTFSVIVERPTAVAAPAPTPTPTPAPAPAPAPAPTAAAARLVPVGNATLTPSTVMGGDIITGQWDIRNDGGQTIRAFLDLDGPGGAGGTARDVPPGQQVTLRVIAQIPVGRRLGPLTYGLVLKDINGRTVSGGVEAITLRVVAEPTPTATPTPTPTPVPTAEPEPLALQPGQIALFPPTASPRTIPAGQGVAIDFTIQNFSGIATNVSVTILSRGPDGRGHGTGRGVVGIPPTGNRLAVITVPIASNAPSGSYGVEILIVQTQFPGPGLAPTLASRVFEGVFRVS